MIEAKDWRAEILRRYREAAHAAADARQFDRLASEVIASMDTAGVDTLGDLFSIPPGDEEGR
jgi:hypothetical protein